MQHDENQQRVQALVGIFDLQVVVAPDDDAWIAQGIEIDYATAGSSPDDVRARFGQGLCTLIQAHLDRFGNIERMIESAPLSTWAEFVEKQGDQQQWQYSSVSIHDYLPPNLQYFPFGNIKYAEAPQPLAAH